MGSYQGAIYSPGRVFTLHFMISFSLYPKTLSLLFTTVPFLILCSHFKSFHLNPLYLHIVYSPYYQILIKSFFFFHTSTIVKLRAWRRRYQGTHSLSLPHLPSKGNAQHLFLFFFLRIIDSCLVGGSLNPRLEELGVLRLGSNWC